MTAETNDTSPCRVLARALETHSCCLTKLDIGHCNLSKEEALEIFNAVQRNDCSAIIALTVAASTADDDIASVAASLIARRIDNTVAPGMSSSVSITSLMHLDLSHNTISAVGAKLLLSAILERSLSEQQLQRQLPCNTDGSTTPFYVSLFDNKIGRDNDGVFEELLDWLDSLRHYPLRFTEDNSSSNIRKQQLREQRTLTFDIGANEIPPAQLFDLVHGLACCIPCMAVLQIAGNDLTDEAAQELEEFLEEQNTVEIEYDKTKGAARKELEGKFGVPEQPGSSGTAGAATSSNGDDDKEFVIPEAAVQGASKFDPSSAPSLELKLPGPFRVVAESAKVREGVELDTPVVAVKERGATVIADSMKFDTKGNWRLRLSGGGTGWMTWRGSNGAMVMESLQTESN